MKRNRSVAILFALICGSAGLTAGCVSAYCHSRSIEVQGEPTYVYPGTQVDMCNIAHGSLVYLLDFPFSFCLDTIALPFDLYAVGIQGRPRCDNPQGPLSEILYEPTERLGDEHTNVNNRTTGAEQSAAPLPSTPWMGPSEGAR